MSDFWEPAHTIIRRWTNPMHARIAQLEELLRNHPDQAAINELSRHKATVGSS